VREDDDLAALRLLDEPLRDVIAPLQVERGDGVVKDDGAAPLADGGLGEEEGESEPALLAVAEDIPDLRAAGFAEPELDRRRALRRVTDDLHLVGDGVETLQLLGDSCAKAIRDRGLL